MLKSAEDILWECLKQVPEHKREFDSDVFNCILEAMKQYKMLNNVK